MPVEIHEFEVSPAPAAPAASSPPAPEARPAPAVPDLPTLAAQRLLASAARELQLRTFAH
ncbi:MAG: hypothetical protein EKK53_03650 [Burkholderiales bacterium]|nr:MAG: hypothetical protein EKK53_03650 [Burkholderiales bacterium]